MKYLDLNGVRELVKKIKAEIKENQYELPTASADILGGIKVGSFLDIKNGVLSGNYQKASLSADGLLAKEDFEKLSKVTAEEMEFLAGVTSKVQTQLDDKLPLAGGTLTGTLFARRIQVTCIGGSWRLPFTQPENAAIYLTNQFNESTYSPLFAVKSQSGHILTFGGNRDVAGFYGYFNIEPGSTSTDWSLVFNMADGTLTYNKNARFTQELRTHSFLPYNAGATIGNETTKWDKIYATQFVGTADNAKAADKLSTIRKVDGVDFDGTKDIVHYNICNIASGVKEKTVACEGFNLVTGARIIVKFTMGNTAENPTLNVNDTGAKPLQYKGAAISINNLDKNCVYEFVYDGENYELVGKISESEIITQKVSGENLELKGSIEAQFNDFVVEGNTWQETREGYNLWNRETETKNSKITTDGDVYCDNTSDTRSPLQYKVQQFNDNTFIKGTDTIKNVSSGGRVFFVGTKVENANLIHIANSGVVSEFHLSNSLDSINVGDKFTIVLEMVDTTVGASKFKNVMLLKGEHTEENLPAYEPYGTMPSPEFPSEIRNCGDNINLLDITLPFTINSEGNTTKFANNIPKLKIGKEYYLYGCFDDGEKFKNDTRLVLVSKAGNTQLLNTGFGNSFVNNIDISEVGHCNIFVTSTYAGKKVKEVSIVEGTKEIPYSPYNCGNMSFKICNKNLFDGKFQDKLMETGIDYTNVNLPKNLEYKDTLDKKYISFGDYFEAGTYTFSINSKNHWYSLNRIAIAGTKCKGSGGTDHIRNSYTWTQDIDGYTYFSLERDTNVEDYTDANFDGVDFMLQIEKDSIATTYEKHQEQKFIFPAKEGQVFHKDDYLTDNGTYQVMGMYEFTGTEDFKKSNHTTDISFCCHTPDIPNVKISGNKGFLNIGKVDNNKNISKYNTGFFYNENESHFLKIEKSFISGWKEELTDAEKISLFKNYLKQEYDKGTPVKLEYELAEPIIEPYSPEQQAVYNQIKQVSSYQNITYIYSTDTTSPIFNVEYFIDKEKRLTGNLTEGTTITDLVIGLSKRLSSPNLDMNALTATKLQTPRNITLNGAVTGQVQFDGSQDATIISTRTSEKSLYYQTLIDLTDTETYHEDTWYPVTAQFGDKNFVHKIMVFSALGTCGVPSWATHRDGFTCGLIVESRSHAYGATGGEEFILDYTCKHTQDNINPLGYKQMNNSSTYCIFMRGGGKYEIYAESNNKWTIHTEEYSAANESVAPVQEAPGVKLNTSTIYANLEGRAKTAGRLAEAKKINEVAFDGTKDITVEDKTKLPLAGGTLTGEVCFEKTIDLRDGLKTTKGKILVEDIVTTTKMEEQVGDINSILATLTSLE